MGRSPPLPYLIDRKGQPRGDCPYTERAATYVPASLSLPMYISGRRKGLGHKRRYEAGAVRASHIIIDGTKIKATASKRRVLDRGLVGKYEEAAKTCEDEGQTPGKHGSKSWVSSKEAIRLT